MSVQHDSTHAPAPTFGRDTRAAYVGLVLGAIVLLAIVLTIVRLTNGKYANERPAAAETK